MANDEGQPMQISDIGLKDNWFTCPKCENIQGFTSVEKISNNSTFDTTCDFCQSRQTFRITHTRLPCVACGFVRTNDEGQPMKVVIDGKTTNLNALDFLKFALDVKTGKRKSLEDIEP